MARGHLCCVIHSSDCGTQSGGDWVRRVFGDVNSVDSLSAIVCNENLPTGQSGAMNATRTFQFSPGCPSVMQGSPVCWQEGLLKIHLTSIVAHTGHPTSCGYLLKWTQFVLSILIPLPPTTFLRPPHPLIFRLSSFVLPRVHRGEKLFGEWRNRFLPLVLNCLVRLLCSRIVIDF